jgi:GNAT superfamily N-acetyltransferase
MAHTIYTIEDRPELRAPINDIHAVVWDEFMQHEPVANHAWDVMFEHFPQHQLALVDDDTGEVLGAAHALPLYWSGEYGELPEGWDASMEQAERDLHEGREPTALTAYAIAVASGHQGKGLSNRMLEAMCASARGAGLRAVIACVRPTLKSKYPLTPIDHYATWLREDGQSFDPWLRVHLRAGGVLVRPAPHAMTFRAPVADWESWTGMRFPESGQYIIPGGLQPIEIDCERDEGIYYDPNIWVVHWV